MAITFKFFCDKCGKDITGQVLGFKLQDLLGGREYILCRECGQEIFREPTKEEIVENVIKRTIPPLKD